MPVFQDVGGIIRAARRKHGLTQEEFASELGIKLSRLQKWESGANEPRFTIPELRRLHKFERRLFEDLMSGFAVIPPGLPPVAQTGPGGPFKPRSTVEGKTSPR